MRTSCKESSAERGLAGALRQGHSLCAGSWRDFYTAPHGAAPWGVALARTEAPPQHLWSMSPQLCELRWQLGI